jgi:hypothetical protein
MCCVTHSSVLLSMLSLVGSSCLVASLAFLDVAAKVEEMCLHGNSHSQGR